MMSLPTCTACSVIVLLVIVCVFNFLRVLHQLPVRRVAATYNVNRLRLRSAHIRNCPVGLCGSCEYQTVRWTYNDNNNIKNICKSPKIGVDTVCCWRCCSLNHIFVLHIIIINVIMLYLSHSCTNIVVTYCKSNTIYENRKKTIDRLILYIYTICICVCVYRSISTLNKTK